MKDDKKEGREDKIRYWGRIVLRHAAAWIVLALFSMWIWSMIKPVLPDTVADKNISESKETTATAVSKPITKTVITVKTPQNATVAPKSSEKLPTTVPPPMPTIPPTTTTTFLTPPVAVNGAQVKNPDALGSAKSVKILVNGLNVRANPSSGGAVIGALGKNETVMVLGYKDQWLYVRTSKNVYGYIKANPKFEKYIN